MALVAVGVSGGISAYKAVEVVRQLQKAGHQVAVVMTRAATRFVGPAHLRGDHPATGDHQPVGARRQRRHRAHRAGLRGGAAARRACHGQHHRQTGARPGGRLPDVAGAGDARARARGAGHEHPHVRPPGDAGQHGAAAVARRAVRRAGRGLPRVRLGGEGPARRAGRHRRRGPADPRAPAGLARTPRRRDRRPHLRGPRSGPLPRQPLERTHGHRRRRRGRATGRRGDARPRTDGARPACRSEDRPGAVGARDARRGRPPNATPPTPS